MKFTRKKFITGLLMSLCITVHAQIESQLTYRRYTTQDGLPQMQTERLWQDSRGYIYIGTLSGFVRYDGQKFTPFLKGRRLNIVGFTELSEGKNKGESGEVRALGFFRQWTIGYDKLESLPLDPQGHWLLNNLNAGSLPNGYVLMEDSLEEHRRLCHMTKRNIVPIMTGKLLDEMTPDRKLFIDTVTGNVYVPTPTGIYVVRKSTKKTVRLSTKDNIYTLLRTDKALLAFASDGIYSVNDKGLTPIAKADWSAASYGLTVRKLHSGSIVVADEHTLYVCNGIGNDKTTPTIRQIVTGINLIRDVLVDRWDRLWMASYQGLYCFFNRSFTNHRLTDENDIVRAVAPDENRHLVIGTLNGKILTFDYLTIDNLTTANAQSSMAINQSSIVNCQLITDDPQQFYSPCAVNVAGKVYMAGNGDVVCIAKGVDGTSSLHWLGLPHVRYQFVGKAWEKVIVGSRQTIISYDPATDVVDTLTTEILHPWCAVQDTKGLLWIGSSSGLFSIDKAHNVKKTEYKNQKLIISAMDADKHGNVFFASADSVFVVRNGKAENLNPQIPTLCGHEVRSLHVSPQGYMVIAVVDGLFVCRIDKDCHLSSIHFFNQQNGFTMTEPLKAIMTETADGTVWLPGIEQMTSFRPADLLAIDEVDTYIAPPLKWWQHWWVWLITLMILFFIVWHVTRWYEKHRNHRKMIRLQHEKLMREKQIYAIRRKAIEEENTNDNIVTHNLAKDIVKMTERINDERLNLRTASGIIVVDVKDIVYFKGDGNYSQIVTFYLKDTVLIGLGTLEKKLDSDIFVRADRSTLVNIHHISSLLPKQRRCIFRSQTGEEIETTLLAPAFKRLQELLPV